ncbi:MAG TPA: metal ABC transporter permease [Thermoplasmata archaeon]|nr:metal ABC transporter permease [Thermoplasmata archaeon]
MSSIWSGEPFDWNLATDLRTMLAFEFMRNAFEAATVIAVVAGIVGYFIVLRKSAFATHALGHTGFSGAAAAVLVGAQPELGLLLFTMTAGGAMALLGTKASNRDVEIGTVLAFALGIGLLFLSLYHGYATEAYSILFGEVLGISSSGVAFTLWAGVAVLAVLAILYRPLLFSSLDEDVAEAKGMPMLFLSLAFMLLLAVMITMAVQIIGVLLIFALAVTPAAIAVRLTSKVGSAVLVSVLIALSAAWSGLFLGFYVNAPVSFLITAIIFSEYVLIRGLGVLRASSILAPLDAPEPDGLRSLRNAALASAGAQVLLMAGALLLLPSVLAHPTTGWDPTALWAHARLSLLLLLSGAGAAALAYGGYLYGFRKMASSSREFAPAALLTLTGLLGLVLAVGGLGMFLDGAYLNATNYALAPVLILFGVPLLLVGIVLSLAGIGGHAIGSWQAGRRYQELALRSGAVLMAVPVVGNLLAYLGYRRALARGNPSVPAPPRLAIP